MAGSEVSREYLEACLNVAAAVLQNVIDEPGLASSEMMAHSNSSEGTDVSLMKIQPGRFPIPVPIPTPGPHPSGSGCDGRFGFVNDGPGPTFVEHLGYTINLLEVIGLVIESLPPGHSFRLNPK